MKKILLGLALFLGGQIGLAGWLIASTSICQRGGVSSIMSALRGGLGIPIAAFYVLMSLTGLVLSIYEIEMSKDEKNNKQVSDNDQNGDK